MIDYLLDLPSRDFSALIERDGKIESLRKTGEWKSLDEKIHDGLRSPEVLPRWYWTMVGMLKNLEAQFASRELELANLRAVTASAEAAGGKATKRGVSAVTYHDKVASISKWKAGSMRFKGGIEVMLAEASYLRERYQREGYLQFREDERLVLLKRVTELEAAIREHKSVIDDPDVADKTLWQMLEMAS
jgi:hypothetical protein